MLAWTSQIMTLLAQAVKGSACLSEPNIGSAFSSLACSHEPNDVSACLSNSDDPNDVSVDQWANHWLSFVQNFGNNCIKCMVISMQQPTIIYGGSMMSFLWYIFATKKLHTHGKLVIVTHYIPIPESPFLDGLECSWNQNYCTLQTQPMTIPCISCGVIPNMGNAMATEAECNHCNIQWKILKNQHNSFAIIGCALHTTLDKAIQDQFKPVKQIGNFGFGNHIAWVIVDALFYTFGHAAVTDISKIDSTNKTPWDPNK